MILAVCAATYGAAAALVFRYFTDSAKLRAMGSRMVACVMEFALYLEEPRVVFRAQRELLRINLRLLRHIGGPCVALAILFAVLYPAMERRFGVRNGDVITLPMGTPLPAGVVAETPPVRIARMHEVSWRIRTSARAGTPHWIVWFFAVSTVTGLAVAAAPGRLRRALSTRSKRFATP
jgi:hypothetical protein